MKKLLAILISLCMLLSLSAVAAIEAGALSGEVDDSTWTTAELSGLICHQGTWLFSDLNDDYEGELWYDYVEEIDSEEYMCSLNMRGFAMSPDRKYAYWGTLNGGSVRGCAMFDFETGTFTDLYYHYEEENAASDATRFSYAKGIAADDRGYVYVGFALSSNYNLVNLGIAQVDPAEKKLNEVSLTAMYEFGAPGDTAGINVGVNGVEVQKIGDRYFCYAMLNYAVDWLVCYDVTDPANPVLNKDFGRNGVLDFASGDCPVQSADFQLNDGNYLDVDEDGTVWLCAKGATGSYGIMKISADGSTLLNVIPYDTAYAVAHEGHYLVVVDKAGAFVDVLDDESFEKVASLKYDDESYGTAFSRAQIFDDILFVSDTDNNNGGAYNVIMAAPLTADAAVKLEEMAKGLTGGSGSEETQPEGGDETKAPSEDDTKAPAEDDTKAPAEDDTKAPAGDDTQAEDTKAPAGDDTQAGTDAETAAAEEDSGCASVMGLSAVLAMIIAAAGYMLSKRD